LHAAEGQLGRRPETILFNKYAEFHSGSPVFSVHAGDSLAYLKSLAEHPPVGLEFLSLVYLDSLDVDFDDLLPSAIQHLKELLAVAPLVSSETLVVVDDLLWSFLGVPHGENWVQAIRPPRIGGKAG
jgi:hypothetical protein